jgi:hypothetical protein
MSAGAWIAIVVVVVVVVGLGLIGLWVTDARRAKEIERDTERLDTEADGQTSSGDTPGGHPPSPDDRPTPGAHGQ